MRGADFLRRRRPSLAARIPAPPAPDAEDVAPSTEQLHASSVQPGVVSDLVRPPSNQLNKIPSHHIVDILVLALILVSIDMGGFSRKKAKRK